MRAWWILAATGVLLAGCENRNDRDDDVDGTETGAAERSGVDTQVTSTRVADTTVIRADTSIDVDTIKKTDNIDDAKDDAKD